MKTVLILEDNDERIAGFQRAVQVLGNDLELRIWRDAPSMRAECEAFFASAALFSLDHDLVPLPGVAGDPGDGLDVARFLGDFLPVCPVLVHSSNTDRVYSMLNEFRFAGWPVDRVGPLGNDWIEHSWLPLARQLMAEHPNTWKARLPSDHRARIERMMVSLDGLSIGDALGEMLCYRAEQAPARLKSSDLPAGPWFHTDDTEMAISLVAVLKSHGCVDGDALSRRFVRRFERDPDRGYGKMTRIQLREILAGEKWQGTAARAFAGQGSMGNGGAMRVAPLGAYFAEEPTRLVAEARASAAVTHTHPEGIAGTVAVAAAASMAWRLGIAGDLKNSPRFFEEVLGLTPESQVRRLLLLASQTPPTVDVNQVAKGLGCGELVTAPDTVPFCVWVAAHHLDNYVEALGETIRVGGDCDTNAAIVGGIVALSTGRAGIPEDWLKAREDLGL